MKPTTASATDSPLALFNQLRLETDGRPSFQQVMENATQWLTLLVGFTLPLSASPSEIATTALIGTWLASANWKRKLAAIRQNAVAWLAVAMFGVLALGVLYSSAGWIASGRCLLKYRELLYIPMLIPVFQDARLRVLGLHSFVAGMIVLVGLSYFEWITGLDLCLPSAPTDILANYDYVTFKDRIVHSVMAAFLIYIAAWKLMEPGTRKWFWGTFIMLALGNILWLLQGRTGYLVLSALTVLFMAQQFGRRGIGYAAALLTVIALTGYNFSPAVRYRVEFTQRQLESHFGPQKRSFWDGRLEFYSNTLTLIARHPAFGTGTGSFEPEYGALAHAQGLSTTVDPHNEYLMLTAQTGLFGGAVFLFLFAAHARLSSQLPPMERRMARGVLVATAVGCLFNSLMLSQTGGVFFGYFSAMAFGALKLTGDSLSATDSPDYPSDERLTPKRVAA